MIYDKYGFIFENEDLYYLEPTRFIEVDTVITDIALFSKNLGINYNILEFSVSFNRRTNQEARAILKYLDDKAGFASQPTVFPKTPLKMIPCTAFFLDWLIASLSSLKYETTSNK